MSFLRLFSPMRAYRDLRVFLSQRRRHEFVFMAASLGLTVLVIAGFVHDSHFEKPYEREILYVESWPLSRTDAEIRAAQKVDAANRAKRVAAAERKRAARQAEFQQLDDKLESWGL